MKLDLFWSFHIARVPARRENEENGLYGKYKVDPFNIREHGFERENEDLQKNVARDHKPNVDHENIVVFSLLYHWYIFLATWNIERLFVKNLFHINKFFGIAFTFQVFLQINQVKRSLIILILDLPCCT